MLSDVFCILKTLCSESHKEVWFRKLSQWPQHRMRNMITTQVRLSLLSPVTFTYWSVHWDLVERETGSCRLTFNICLWFFLQRFSCRWSRRFSLVCNPSFGPRNHSQWKGDDPSVGDSQHCLLFGGTVWRWWQCCPISVTAGYRISSSQPHKVPASFGSLFSSGHASWVPAPCKTGWGWSFLFSHCVGS